MREELVIARFVRAALAGRPITIAGSGEQRRNYVYVEDLAAAHVRALAPAAAGQVLALEGATPVSVREIAGTVRELIAPVPVVHVPARTADYQGVSVSNRLTKDVLAWSPQTSFRAGIRRYPGWLWDLREDLPSGAPAGAPPARPGEGLAGAPPARRTAREAR